MRQPVESLGLYVVMISTGDLETSVGCWALLGIDLRGDNSGEKVRGCGNAETEQLYPFSFYGAVPMRPLTEVSADITEW